MRLLTSCALAAALLAASTFAANAALVNLSDTVTGNGDTLIYDFTGLPRTALGDGVLTIATVAGRTLGIDLLDASGEFMDVRVDGVDFGRWECGIANDGGTLIPFAVDRGTADCEFSLSLPLPLAQLSGFIADGRLEVRLGLGPDVTDTGDGDVVRVTLIYPSPEVAVIPLPATLPLLAAGLGGLAVLRRRRRA